MTIKYRRSLHGRFFLLMLSIALITGIFVFIFTVRKGNRIIEGKFIQENKNLAQIISQNIEVGYLSHQWPFAFLEQVSRSPNVLFWWLVRPDGKIYLADQVDIWGLTIKDSSLGTKEQVIKNSISLKTGERIKLIVQPVKIDELKEPWSFYLGVPLGLSGGAKYELFASTIFLLIGIIFLIGILSFFSAKNFLKPIKELINKISIISNGNLDLKIKIKTGDEIEELANAFNKMTFKLKELYTTLEKRVVERTKELENSRDLVLFIQLILIKKFSLLIRWPKKLLAGRERK